MRPDAADMHALLAQVDEDLALTQGLTGIGAMGPAVRAAMAAVPRPAFVPPELRELAYENRPLPIGEGQTISQPFIVALMTELLDLDRSHRVLEIGTGCGYQTAVLARLAGTVHSVEILPALAAQAARRLASLRLDGVALHVGDGHAGWPAAAPYDRIVVTAAPPAVPASLAAQLRPGGRMVLPLGADAQTQMLCVVDKAADGTLAVRETIGVRFVPMTGG